MPPAWIPIENNPDVLNPYLTKLGASDAKAEFVDVYGVSEDLLAMVPTPVYAVLFVYPITDASEQKAKRTTDAQAEEVGQFLKANRLFYTKQYTQNACGTIAVLHAVFNNVDAVTPFAPDSTLAALHATATSGTATAEELGALFRDDAQLAVAHGDASVEGATSLPAADTPVDLHFVCFVHIGGRCVELDGRQANPILHAACASNEAFLAAAAAAIAEKMADNPDSVEFSITALAAKAE